MSIMINNITEEVLHFKYPSCYISYRNNQHINEMLQ